jgi:hypothetical protein
MADQIMKGTPPLVFLPAKNYVFKVLDGHHIIEIPRKGNYHDLAPDFFKEEAGSFDILNDKGILFTPSLTKVLFATKKYPDLEYNQLFVPHTLEFREDYVNIVGQVIELSMKELEDEVEGE